MKTNKFVLSACFASTLLLVGCEAMLNTNPKDSLTESSYFKTPEQFQYAANNLHANVMGWVANSKLITANDTYPVLFDYGSDIISRADNAGSGTNSAPTADVYWKACYTWLRTVNQVIEKGEAFSSPASITTPIGQAYFFRAWHHFFLLKRFGGVPIANKVTDVSDDIVWGSRASRYEVVAQILSDLDIAIDKLKSTTIASTGNDGHVTIDAAKALKARVCLFEATWERYVQATTDGDGTSVGAGSAKPANYPSVTDMLTMAKNMAKDVIDTENYELWKGVETVGEIPNPSMYANSSYFYLFNLDGAASNPNGLSKSSNKEAVYRCVFDYVNRQGAMNLSHTKPATPTRKLMDMFLCTDGLPVQHSPLFKKYHGMKDEFQNRDYRLTSCVKEPFSYSWGFGKTSTGAKYNTDITSNPQSSAYFYVPSLRSAGSVGYESRKFATEQAGRSSDSDESSDYLQIRLAEVYLIYAEATCELGNGEISDGDLNYSLNKVRARAGVAPLTHALIAPYSDLTLLGEIRRERALELFGEGHRISDLCRWGIAEEDMAGYPICGVYAQYEGEETEYATAISPKDNKPVLDAASISPQDYTVSSYAGIATQKAGAVIEEQAANRKFALKNYLQPIPTDQIKLNPKLLQNPKW